MKKTLILLLIARFTLFSSAAIAGKLADFENDVNKPRQSDVSYSDVDQDVSGDCFGNMFNEIFSDIATLVIVGGGAMSMARIEPDRNSDVEEFPVARKQGEPLIPFARIDVAYRDVVSDVKATDYVFEAGYGAFGLLYNTSRYKESAPADSLDIEHYFVTYRMSLGSTVELDIGAGEFVVSGKTTTTAFTAPLRVHLENKIQIELTPVWAENVFDHDLSILYGFRYVFLKTGYRWVKSANHSLSGPYIGLSARF